MKGVAGGFGFSAGVAKMIELSSRTISEGRRWLCLCTRQACLSALGVWTPFPSGPDSLGGGLSSCNAPSVQESTQTRDIHQESDEASLRLTSPTNHASAESQAHEAVTMKRIQLTPSPRIDSFRGHRTYRLPRNLLKLR